MCFDIEDFSASLQSLVSNGRDEKLLVTIGKRALYKHELLTNTRKCQKCFFKICMWVFFRFPFFERHHSQLNDIFPFTSFETWLFLENLEMGQRPKKGFLFRFMADGKICSQLSLWNKTFSGKVCIVKTKLFFVIIINSKYFTWVLYKLSRKFTGYIICERIVNHFSILKRAVKVQRAQMSIVPGKNFWLILRFW